MPYSIKPRKKKRNKNNATSFNQLYKPANTALKHAPPLTTRGDRPLQMEFEHQLKSLIFFHLEEHESGRHLLQVLEEDEFAQKVIAPPAGIKKSSYFEAINTRGLEQLSYVYQELYQQAQKTLPPEYEHLGELVALDGSLIDACLSMEWADYRKGAKKAKIHLGFDLNHGIPSKIFLTDGKSDERPFVSKIIAAGQTGVLDRYYQCHKAFDQWQEQGRSFVCRIKAGTHKTVIKHNPVKKDSIVFYDAIVLLGTPGANQTQREVRLVGYRVDHKNYWVATNRFDLTAEDIALIFKLRWNIETFFGWWKKHLKVYHLIARSPYGLMVQILSGLITYLLLAIYCHEQFQEKVSIKRVRQLRIKIQNELRQSDQDDREDDCDFVKERFLYAYAKT